MIKPKLLLALLIATPALAADPVKPAGAPLSDEARDCSGAHDHCIRAETWFVTGFTDEDGMSSMKQAFQQGGKFYTWKGNLLDGGTAYRTKVATAGTAEVEARAKTAG